MQISNQAQFVYLKKEKFVLNRLPPLTLFNGETSVINELKLFQDWRLLLIANLYITTIWWQQGDCAREDCWD